MTLTVKLARAEALQLQIKQMEREIEEIYDQATRDTFWLKAGDIIALEKRQRRHLLGKVKVERFYYVVELVSAYESQRFKEDRAVLWVWRINSNTGRIDRTSGGCLRYQGHRVFRKLGQLDDYQHAECIDLDLLGVDDIDL